jgi:hypothetical protein
MKKGLSNIVATVLIVLLAVAAVGLVWGVIKGVLTEESGNIKLRQESLELNLVRFSILNLVSSNGGVDFSLRRDVGGGRVDGFYVVLTDSSGEVARVLDETSVGEYETVGVSIPSGQPGLTGTITRIAIVPVRKDSDTGKIISAESPVVSKDVEFSVESGCARSGDCDSGECRTASCEGGTCVYSNMANYTKCTGENARCFGGACKKPICSYINYYSWNVTETEEGVWSLEGIDEVNGRRTDWGEHGCKALSNDYVYIEGTMDDWVLKGRVVSVEDWGWKLIVSATGGDWKKFNSPNPPDSEGNAFAYSA